MAVIEGSYAIPDGYTDNPGRRLIQGMLCKQPEKRLGAGLQGWGEIKGNKFFQGGMSGHLFDKLLGREIDPPVCPPAEMYSEEGRVETVTLSDSELLGDDEDDFEEDMYCTRTKSPTGRPSSPRTRSPRGSSSVPVRHRLGAESQSITSDRRDSSPRCRPGPRSASRSHSPKILSPRGASDNESGLTPVPPAEPRRGPAHRRSRASEEAVEDKIDEGKIAMKLREEVASARNDHSEVSTDVPDAGEGEKRVERGAT